MRHNKRFSRVPAMLADPEIPRRADGLIRMCHHCQRQMYFDGGFMSMVVKHLERLTKFGRN